MVSGGEPVDHMTIIDDPPYILLAKLDNSIIEEMICS
jgi:hypothetical protein